jgi:hypothetical protein
MAIIAPQTAPNYATGNYWKIIKSELLCSPDEPVERMHYVIAFYASEAARHASPNRPLWTESIFRTIEQIIADGGTDPREGPHGMYAQIMKDPRFAGTNAASDVDGNPIPPGPDE